jgi:hypothetical protein
VTVHGSTRGDDLQPAEGDRAGSAHDVAAPLAMILGPSSAQTAAAAVEVSRTRSPTRADWRLMLGMSRDDAVLVIGQDARELGRALAPYVGQVSAAVDNIPTCGSTRILAMQANQPSVPLLESSLDWVVFDGALPGNGDVSPSVARILPTLKPGGRVVMTFVNRWGVGRLLQPRRRAHKSDGASCHGLGHAVRLMSAAGLSDVACYATLPGRRAPRTLIPLIPPCPAAAEKFALDQAWKRASRRRAIGRLALHGLVNLRMLRFLYPHYLVVGRRRC